MRPGRRNDRGSALLVSVLLLVLMGALGIAALDTVQRDQQVAGFQKRARGAFYAAEAGVADARSRVRQVGSRTALPGFPDAATPQMLGQPGDFAFGQPSYLGDPAFPNPIRYVGEGAPCTEGCRLNLGGAGYNYTRWQINVIGRSAEGATSRLEAVEVTLLGTGYGG